MDKNIIGRNGLDIQCLEHTVPPGRSSISYDPIPASKAGNYTLDRAEVTYINPDTGKEESTMSNTLQVMITKGSSGSLPGAVRESITSIYRCGGINMMSTSKSLSSSFSFSFGTSPSSPLSPSSPSRGPQKQQPQQPQDTNALKQEMEKQLKERKEMENALEDIINNSTKFRAMENQLFEWGYGNRELKITPTTNTSGSFKSQYTRNGTTAWIEGEIEGGKIKNLRRWSMEDREVMENKIENASQFQDMEKGLEKKGLSQTKKEILPGKDSVYFNYSYTGSKGEHRYIIGNATYGGEIKDIEIVGNEKGLNIYPYLAILAALLLIAVIYVYYSRHRHQNKHRRPVISKPEPITHKVTPAPGVNDPFIKAEELFKAGKKKEAFSEISGILRSYFKDRYGIKRELTSREVMDIMDITQPRYRHHRKLKRCLDMCDMVEFAAYNPGDGDFKSTVQAAREIYKTIP